MTLTACRPERPSRTCAHCQRSTLPTHWTDRAGRSVATVVIDPTAVLPTGRPCPLYAPARAFQEAA